MMSCLGQATCYALGGYRVTDTIYLIVEGDGEETAAPALIRRLLYEEHQEYQFEIKAINAKGNSNIKSDLERFLELTRRISNCCGVLVLFDVETVEICPVELARLLATRAKELKLPFPVVVVCAVCEYESWFLANIEAIHHRLKTGAKFDGDPEQKCNAKEWLTAHMSEGRIYKETLDQVKMTTDLNIHLVKQNIRSFRRLCNAVKELLDAVYAGEAIVTPE